MRNFISFLIRYKYVCLLLLTTLFITFGSVATGLQIEPDFSALISDDSEFNTNERILEQTYQENNGLIIFYNIKDKTVLPSLPTTLNTSEFKAHTSEFKQALESSQYVTDARDVTISENGKAAFLSVSLYVPNEVNVFKDVKAEIDGLSDEVPAPPGVEKTVSGFPTILDRTATLLITDNLTTVAITVVLVFIILYLYFLDVKLAAIGMATPLLSVISLAAIMVLLDINVTLTLAAVGVLIIGLGADYSIHLIVAFERNLTSNTSAQEAVLDAVDELKVPITASFLTTAAGFIALLFASGPSSIAQGTVLSIGITLIYLITFLCLPVLLVSVGENFNHEKNTFFTWLQERLARIAIFQGRYPYAVIGVVILLTAFFSYGASMVYFSTSNSNWIPEDDPVRLSFTEYVWTFGNTDSLQILVQADDNDLRSVDSVRSVQRLAAQLKGLPNVDTVQHPFKDVSLTRQAIREHTQRPRIKEQFNEDYTFTTITLTSKYFEVSEEGNAVILQRVRDLLDANPPRGLSFSLYGDAVRFEELGESLQGDTFTTTVYGLLLVTLVSSLAYASFTIGFAALIPVILALVWAVGLMGYTGVPFTSISTGLLSLVLGIGVDFSIHIVDSIERYLETNNINNAIYKSLTTSGSAIVLSSITTLFGFLALSFSSLLGTQRFGWSLALSIIAALGVTLILVPAIMSIRHRYTNGDTA